MIVGAKLPTIVVIAGKLNVVQLFSVFNVKSPPTTCNDENVKLANVFTVVNDNPVPINVTALKFNVESELAELIDKAPTIPNSVGALNDASEVIVLNDIDPDTPARSVNVIDVTNPSV
jgi:LEA14-like dessication related protein